MSLEYYILCNKAYTYIIKDLRDILQWKHTLQINKPSHTNESDVFSEMIDDELIKNEINRYMNCNKICSRYIINNCKHEYIEDEIDIDENTSKKILYCRICEHTK